MEYYIAECVVEVVEFLEYPNTKENKRYEEQFSNVINSVRRLGSVLTNKEIEKILVEIQLVLEMSEQVVEVDKGQSRYFSGNMVGKREFDIKYKEIFSNDKIDLPIMKQFLADFIKDLKIVDIENTKRDIEYSLRNLEVYIREHIKFDKNKEVNARLIENFINVIEVR